MTPATVRAMPYADVLDLIRDVKVKTVSLAEARIARQLKLGR